MGLKLFRTTEYSSSSLFTHTRPQAGLWPATLLIISGLWLAGPGNVALWRAVVIGTSGTGALLAIALGAGIAGFVCALLSVVAWRGLLKPAVSVLLMLSAIGAWMLLSEPPPAGFEPWSGWKRVLLVLALFIVPMLMVWRAPVRLVSLRRQFTGNAIILAASLAVLAAVLAVAGQNLQALTSYKPGWACMINPAAAVLKLTGQCTAARS